MLVAAACFHTKNGCFKEQSVFRLFLSLPTKDAKPRMRYCIMLCKLYCIYNVLVRFYPPVNYIGNIAKLREQKIIDQSCWIFNIATLFLDTSLAQPTSSKNMSLGVFWVLFREVHVVSCGFPQVQGKNNKKFLKFQEVKGKSSLKFLTVQSSNIVQPFLPGCNKTTALLLSETPVKSKELPSEVHTEKNTCQPANESISLSLKKCLSK